MNFEEIVKIPEVAGALHFSHLVEMCPGIVVIEDDPDIREAVCDLLEFEGYTVEAFENGKEAMERLHECRNPCLILLDLMMPVMDGWQFLEARRGLGDTIAALPCYIVSAVADPRDVRQRGAKGFLKKPVDAEALLQLVRSHCPLPQHQEKAAAVQYLH